MTDSTIVIIARKCKKRCESTKFKSTFQILIESMTCHINFTQACKARVLHPEKASAQYAQCRSLRGVGEGEERLLDSALKPQDILSLY